MRSPALAVGAPALFVMTRSGAASIGVVSLAVLFAGLGSAPPDPSSATDAVFESCSTPPVTGLSMVTAKVAVTGVPTTTFAPRAKVHTDPAGAPFAQLQF